MLKNYFFLPKQVKKGTGGEVSVATPQPSFSDELPDEHMRRLVPHPRGHNLEPMEIAHHPPSPPSTCSLSSSLDLPDWRVSLLTSRELQFFVDMKYTKMLRWRAWQDSKVTVTSLLLLLCFVWAFELRFIVL